LSWNDGNVDGPDAMNAVLRLLAAAAEQGPQADAE
jgi:hypothetical protein